MILNFIIKLFSFQKDFLVVAQIQTEECTNEIIFLRFCLKLSGWERLVGGYRTKTRLAYITEISFITKLGN